MTIYYNFYCKLSCSSDINNLYDSLYLFFMNWPSNSGSLELGWPDTAGSWQLAVMQLWLPDCIFSKLGWAGLGGGERGNFLGVIIVSPPGYSPNIRAAKISQSEKDWLCSSSSYPALNYSEQGGSCIESTLPHIVSQQPLGLGKKISAPNRSAFV